MAGLLPSEGLSIPGLGQGSEMGEPRQTVTPSARALGAPGAYRHDALPTRNDRVRTERCASIGKQRVFSGLVASELADRSQEFCDGLLERGMTDTARSRHALGELVDGGLE